MTNKLGLLLLILTLGLPLAVSAQEPELSITGNFPCKSFKELSNELREKHNEIPVLSGMGVSRLLNLESRQLEFARHDMIIFVNPESYAYSLIFTLNVGDEEIGCIVSSGRNFGPVIQEDSI